MLAERMRRLEVTIRMRLLFPLLVSLAFTVVPALAQQTRYPFNDPNLPADKRIDNLLSLMTVDEKIDVLGTQTGVPRLGVPNIGSSEGIHPPSSVTAGCQCA